MAKFTRKEIKIADILLELVDLIPRFDRRNPRLAFPNWNLMKRSRCLPRRSFFAMAGLPISRPNSCFLHLDYMAPSPSSISPSKGRKDGIIIDLNKNPEDVFTSKELDPSPSEKPLRSPHKGFTEQSFIDVNGRNSDDRVIVNGDKFEVDITMNVQSSKPILEKKRKREESMILSRKVKKI
ncbi:hypothetical protein M5K25_017112 [Dendrobium thyrsiflorum]|uniref:Uncharacterized protein n=1 Tax=Dendrobium thyrsiflorum TaxID=117978 RepID=A0ABD0ULM9_DENTH